MKPGLQIHLSILLSIIIFNVFYFVLSNNLNENKDNKVQFNINYKFITVMCILGILLIIPNTITSVNTLLTTGFSLSSVRINYASLSYSQRFFYMFFTNNIPIAIFSAASIITAIDLANNKRNLLKISLICIFIGTITFGGRYLILNFIIYYISAFLILKKYKDLKIKKSYILIAIIILAIVTLLRGTTGLSVFDMGVLYYVGSFSFLEFILSHPNLYGLLDPPMYGYLTFGFLLEPFILTLKLFFALDIDVPSYHFNVYAQPFVNIGVDKVIYYNNNTTILYTFIRDFGKSGVVVGTALLTSAVCIFQKLFKKTRSIRAIGVLVLLYSLIFNSTMVYNLTSIASSLLIIFLLIFSREKKQNENIQNK
ncbi:hypothetical protein PBOR_28950 [Paenibacillus borealis]|uniref:Oligosaccharide repeat unit polymerase n=2 Tax=Paenibacillus borealis TaxID=160799 RepID=A0A089LG88_PAEBO|nr:hypothetical protein PBOR_28950 [Paenibacillus borealis]